MIRHRLYIEGLAFWAPALPSWTLAQAAFRGEAKPLAKAERVPLPLGLPSAERRRAPVTVALALAVSAAAIEAAGRQPDEPMAVFASAHGDLPMIDQVCDALAHDPLQVSPTRFLHTIHNAPAAYWSMLCGNRHRHTAVCAAEHSFAAGLLEAAVLATASNSPVLLTGYDTAAVGHLTHTTRSGISLAMALVLHPERGPRAQFTLDWATQPEAAVQSPPTSDAARGLVSNGMAQALPLFEALAQDSPAPCVLSLAPRQSLHLWPQNLPTDTSDT